MGMDDVRKLFMGELEHRRRTTPRRSSSSTPPGARSTPASWRTSPPTSWTARRCWRPGSDGINGVRLANAIHLSSWTGTEVPLDFDEDEYLAELNKRIADEGKFPERS